MDLRRIDLFAFNEVYRIVCLAHCILFFLLNGSERHRFSVRLSECTHPRTSLILQRNCRRCTGSRPTQEGCPRRTITSVPSASRMMHRCQGFAVAADAAAASVAAVQQHMRLHMTR